MSKPKFLIFRLLTKSFSRYKDLTEELLKIESKNHDFNEILEKCFENSRMELKDQKNLFQRIRIITQT